MTETDDFYNKILKGLEGTNTCPSCGRSFDNEDKLDEHLYTQHGKRPRSMMSEAQYKEKIGLPIGPGEPNYNTDKLVNSPEDNVYVPDDTDEDDQYITNINKYIFNDNDILEPVSAPGQVKKSSEADDEKICGFCGNVFDNQKDLDKHINVRHGDSVSKSSEVDSNVCQFCGIKQDEHDNPNHHIEGRSPTDHYFSSSKIEESLESIIGNQLYNKEANDDINLNYDGITMNVDPENENIGKYPNTEPEAMSTLDQDTAPLSEEGYDPQTVRAIFDFIGPEANSVSYDDLVNRFGKQVTDTFLSIYLGSYVRFVQGDRIAKSLGGTLHDPHAMEANDSDMSTGLYDETDKNDNTNEFGYMEADTQEDPYANTSESKKKVSTEDAVNDYWKEYNRAEKSIRDNKIKKQDYEDHLDSIGTPYHIATDLIKNKEIERQNGGYEAQDIVNHGPGASRYYECGTCGDSFDTFEEYNQHKKDYPGNHDSPNTKKVKGEAYDEGKPLHPEDAKDWRDDETYNEFKARREKEGRPLRNSDEVDITGVDNPQDAFDVNKSAGNLIEEMGVEASIWESPAECPECHEYWNLQNMRWHLEKNHGYSDQESSDAVLKLSNELGSWGKESYASEGDYVCNVCGVAWDQHDNPNHHIPGRTPTDHYFSGDDLSDDNEYGFEPKNLDYFNRAPRKGKEAYTSNSKIQVTGRPRIEVADDVWSSASHEQRLALLKALGYHESWADANTVSEMPSRGGGMLARDIMSKLKILGYGDEAMAFTGGKYPSDERTEDETSLDDDAGNIGAVDDKIREPIGQVGEVSDLNDKWEKSSEGERTKWLQKAGLGSEWRSVSWDYFDPYRKEFLYRASNEVNTWSDDDIVMKRDKPPLQTNVDGPKDEDYQQAVQHVDAEPNMPMGEAVVNRSRWDNTHDPIQKITWLEKAGYDKSAMQYYDKKWDELPDYVQDQIVTLIGEAYDVKTGWVPELSTVPTDDDYKRNNPENKCVMCGRKFDTLQQWKDHMNKLGPHNSTTIGVNEAYATEEIGGMCGICHGEVSDIYNHVKEEHPEYFAKWRKAHVSDKPIGSGEANTEPWYSCPQCSMIFETEQQRNDHVDDEHDESANSNKLFESLRSDCGCDKGKEAFYKPLIEKLGGDYNTLTEAGIEKEESPMAKDNWNALGEDSTFDTVKKYPFTWDKKLKKDDSEAYGENKPYWCKECGDEFDTSEQVEQHMKNTGHSKEAILYVGHPGEDDKGTVSKIIDNVDDLQDESLLKDDDNTKKEIKSQDKKDSKETIDIEWNAMNPIQRYEWLSGKIGAFEVIEKFPGVVGNTWNKLDLSTQRAIEALDETSAYSYNFKKKDPKIASEDAYDLEQGDLPDFAIEEITNYLNNREEELTHGDRSKRNQQYWFGRELRRAVDETGFPEITVRAVMKKWGAQESFANEFNPERISYEPRDPHPKSICSKCGEQYKYHNDEDHDFEGDGNYDPSDDEYDRMRDNEVKKKSVESTDNPTEEDVKTWWDEKNNISQRQHAIDPNRHVDEESYEFCKLDYDQIDDKYTLYVGYSFRHQKADMTALLGYDVHETTQIWWDTYNSSQHQHMIDPHQILDTMDFSHKNYIEMNDEEKDMVEKLYDHKHSETSKMRGQEFINATVGNKGECPYCAEFGDPYDIPNHLFDRHDDDLKGLTELGLTKHQARINPIIKGDRVETSSIASEGDSDGKGNTAQYRVRYYRPDVGGTDKVTITGWNNVKDFARRVGGIEELIDISRNGKSLGFDQNKLNDFERQINESYAGEGGHGSGRTGHAPWMKPITQKIKSPETSNDIPIDKINEVRTTRDILQFYETSYDSYICPIDNEKYNNLGDFKDHVYTIHKGSKLAHEYYGDDKYTCKICGEDFGGHDVARFHVRDEHGYKDQELANKQIKLVEGEGLLSDMLKKKGQDFSYCNYCNARTMHKGGQCMNCPPPKLTNQDIKPKRLNNIQYYDAYNIMKSDDKTPDDQE